MKKNVLIILVVMVLLVGCGKKEDIESAPSIDPSSTTTTSTTTATETTTKVKTTLEKKTTKSTTKKSTIKKTTSCTKVFSKKYSVVTKDKESCQKQGNLKFLELSDNGEGVFAYECEEIKDACGDVYYGAFYWIYDHDKNTEVKVYR